MNPRSTPPISRIVSFLDDGYPFEKTALFFKTPFELLMATILSAQCTDAQVNRVTPQLFTAFPTAREMAAASILELEEKIYSTGFYRNKAKNLKAAARQLMARHEGQVPQSREALTQLPGVGRKTANVVRGHAFDLPGMVVDTHVARVSQRLGLTHNKQAEKIESDLMALVAENRWTRFSHQLILFGRDCCRARKPQCSGCGLNDICPYPDKTAI